MNRRAALLALSLLLPVLACTIPGTTDPAEVARQVEATLSAVPPPGVEPSATVPPAVVTPEPPAVLRVVFTNGGNVWLWQEAGGLSQLTSSGGAVRVLISDDGARVAFLRQVDPSGTGHTELRAVNADGSGETTLLTAAALDALYPPVEATVGIDISLLDFIPGSHDLLANTYRIPEFIGLYKNDDLLRIDADSGSLTPLLAPGDGGDFAVSPDGSLVAITTPTSVGLVNPDGTNLRPGLVTFPYVITYSEYMFYPTPVWAPDSSAVGITMASEDPLAPLPSGTTWIIPADGGPAASLGTISGMFFFTFREFSPLAPTHDRVAFARETGTPNVRDLLVAAPSGAGESLIATGDSTWQGWAPDGAHFLYTLGGPFALHLGTVGGGAAPVVTGTDARWLNSGEFLYLEYGGAGATLYRHALAGGSTMIATLSGTPYSFDAAD